MPKYLVIADPHFHAYKNHSRLINGVNSRLLDIGMAFEEAVAKGIEEKCSHMLIAGDVFHVRGVIRPSTFCYVHGLLEEATKHMQVFITPGNHDMENYRGGSTSVDTFKKIDVVFVDSCPSQWGDLLLIPYIHDHDEFKRVFKKTSFGCKVVVIHQGIDDFRGTKLIPETGLTVEWLEEHTDAWVVSGHYHKPKLKRKCLSPGSLIQHNFGDEGSDKGFWILDSDNNKCAFHKTTYPEFLTIQAETIDDLPSDLDNKIVRIKTKNIKGVDDMRQTAIDRGAIDVVAVLEREFKTAHEQVITIDSPANMVAKYVEMMPNLANNRDRVIKMFGEVCL